jgi:DNA polymerase-1
VNCLLDASANESITHGGYDCLWGDKLALVELTVRQRGGTTPSMPKKSLYLIDGHAQIYRAYYAPFAPLTSPSGVPTRAVHVFMQMLLNLLKDRKPDYLAMTLDVGDETVFRVEIDPEYKAHRDPPPEDLPPQIESIVSLLEAMRVPILRLKGFEADDIMATLADRLAGDDLDVYLVSRDKDLDQLLNDHVRLYDPGKDRVIDAAAMREEKGYGPALAVEAQMLMGDSTDNVKGVMGVGPKKAAQLLEKYGSVAAIIAHADELTPKLRESVLAFKDRQEVVRQLVTLRRDVPLELDLSAADVGRIDAASAVPMLRELGLNRLTELVTAYAGKGEEGKKSEKGEKGEKSGERGIVGVQGGLFDESEHAASARSEAPARGRYELIDTDEKLRELGARLAKVKAFAFDTETTASLKDLATNPAFAQIAGISVSWEAGCGCYVPIRGIGATVSEDSVRNALGTVFADAKIAKYGQNAKFDIRVLKNIGVEVAGVAFDTMIASFVLDSTRRSHGMNWLSEELLHYRPIPIEDVLGKGRDQKVFAQVPTDRACEYAAEDADVTWRLHGALESQMTDVELTSLFRDLEMPLIEVLVDMEQAGIALDTDLTARLSGQMADRMKELEEEIHAAAGRPFNLDSTKQLAEVLFDERKLPVIKRTKTGRSTDAEVLEQLTVQTADPIPKLLLEYREITKLKGTYVDALPEMVSPRTGRIHPNFSQIGAVTGRLSCSDPNLQNIPIRTPMGAQIRRAFVPGDADSVLIKADYSQIELRVLAHFSKDKALAKAFAEDRDIHAFVASQIDGVPLDDVTGEQRARAKTVNFGIIYGQSAFGLARQTGMSQNDAKLFIERYFNRYPRIRGFLDECIAHARRHGYVKTMLGRRRTIADINSRNQTARNAAERLAVNTVVQGTAADLIKRAMINLHRRIISETLPLRMLLQVHDELVFETPSGKVEQMKPIIEEEMAGAIKLDVPVRVDVSSGPNWLDVK